MLNQHGQQSSAASDRKDSRVALRSRHVVRSIAILATIVDMASPALAQDVVAAPGSTVVPIATARDTLRPRARTPLVRRGPARGPGAQAPESSQGQVTSNAPANGPKPPNAGVLPFVPPFFTQFPTGEKLAVDTKGIQFNSPDDAMKFRIGGRLQEDFSAASISPGRYAPALADNGQGRGIDTRRAYFESYLSIQGGYEFAFQYDFNDAVRPIVDAVVSYHGFNPLVATVGNFKEPFSLNQLQSDNTTTFTERSLMDAFAPGRSFGGAVGGAGKNFTVTGGVYGNNANFGPGTNGVAGTGRITYAPILTDTQVLHFGFAGSYRQLDRTSPNQPSFSSKPEDYVFARSLVSTGTLRNADDVVRLNAELLYQWNAVRLQGEYTHVDVNGYNGQPDRSFDGGYVEAAWVVNGKGRVYRITPPYGSEFAVLQGVVIDDSQRVSQGGYGVFEVAGRFSAIDLQSKNTTGGYEQDFTAGVNWYPDRNIRFMADYVHADADPSVLRFPTARGPQQKVTSDLFVGRVNFSW